MKRASCKLIFLSEPQTYQCDLSPLLQPFLGSYEAYLNSEDVFDMDLPLTYPKPKGGTMVIWHISLSPHLKVLHSTSPCFISVLLSPPGIQPSLHTAVYLPTAGRDGKWLGALAELEQHVQDITYKHGPLAIFLLAKCAITLGDLT